MLQLLMILMRRPRFWLKKELAEYYSRRQKDILMPRENFNFPANFPLAIAPSCIASSFFVATSALCTHLYERPPNVVWASLDCTLVRAEVPASGRLAHGGVPLFVKWMEPHRWFSRTSSRQTIDSTFSCAERALFLNGDTAAGFLK